MLSITNKTIAALAASGFLLGAIPAANAETRGFTLEPTSLAAQGPATVTSTLNLPDAAGGVAFATFVLPPDYARNTPVRMVMHVQTTAACSAVLAIGVATRRRPGFPSINTSSPVDAITPVGGSNVATFAGAGFVVAKTYLVRKPLAAPFSGMQAGDGVSVRFDRLVDDAADNCATTLFVTAVEVRYETTP